jgi:hypothetical protein
VLSRSARRAGLALVEAKLAAIFVSAPTLATLKAKKTRELNSPATASAEVPKVLSSPT